MKTSRYEIFVDTSGQWRWRLRSRNSRIVAQSEGYTRKDGAWRGAFAASRAAKRAQIVEAGR